MPQNMDDSVSAMDTTWSDPDNTMDFLQPKSWKRIQVMDKKVRERLTPVKVMPRNNSARLNLE